MKRFLPLALALVMLAGCGQAGPTSSKAPASKKAAASKAAPAKASSAAATAVADKGALGLFKLVHAQLDGDHDGKLSAEEFAANAEEEMLPGLPAFAAIDADKDGGLSLAEFTSKELLKGKGKLFQERAAKEFAGLDANKDKALAKKEMEESDVPFAAADADKNGKVTVAEFEAALAEALTKQTAK